MVANPGQTIKDMVVSALRPDQALAEVSADLRRASAARGGWGKAARGASATSKMTGVVAGVLAVLAVVGMFTPGVNVMFLLQASFAFAMGSAALALVESELYVRAAGDAGDARAFEEEIRLGAEARTRAAVATAGMATALAGMLVARVPLPGRLRSIGHTLDAARSAVAKSAGTAWQGVRARTIDRLRQSTRGLVEALDDAAQPLARTRAELDGMTAAEFYQRIARDDALRQAVGIREDVARSLAELARTEHGAASARQMFDQLRQSYRDAPALAREQVEPVIAQVERAIAELEAATSPAQLDAALARARASLSDDAVASHMADTRARHTAARLEALVEQERTGAPARKGLETSNAESRSSTPASQSGAARVRGYYEDGTPAYDGNIKPGRLRNITRESEWKLGHEEAKMDTGNGRVYQRRVHVQTPEGERLVIDVDFTNHGRGDHPVPHYHIYRYKGGSWSKKGNGIPSTGLQGEPPINGSTYTGPRPWK